jgi:hypothetical protein
MFASAPQSRLGYVVHKAVVGTPYLIAVVAVAQSQLFSGNGRKLGIFQIIWFLPANLADKVK